MRDFADLLRRLKLALPHLINWVDELIVSSKPSSRSVSELESPRLASYFPRPLREYARVCVVPSVPFPPILLFGLPEFVALQEMPMHGITFKNTFFIQDAAKELESVYAHELVHVQQWKTLEPTDFLLTYGVGLLTKGYEASLLEAMAFRVQRDFEDDRPVSDLLPAITRGAFAAREEAQAVFAANAVAWN